MKDNVVIIASWDGDDAEFITIQDFIINGEKVIPIFSDEAAFERQTRGSGFEKQASS